MAVKISIVESYKHYGKCLKITNDLLEILITVDVGPRIIYFAAPGGENLLFNDESKSLGTSGELFESVFGVGERFFFYGGHRMWLAPQLMIHTSVPDNDPVKYTLIENGVKLTPETQEILGVQPYMKVTMPPDEARISIEVRYTNISEEEKQHACWQITQMAPGGVAFVPFMPELKMRNPGKPGARMPDFDLLKPLVPRGVLAMFIGGFDDPRFGIDSRYITLKHDPSIYRPIKFGNANKEGWAMYANKGQMITLEFEHNPDGQYTDGGSSFECFASQDFLELESLGELITMKPGDTITHTETLSLGPMLADLPDLNDRLAVAEFVDLHRVHNSIEK
jgi:hypothetical protein